MKKRIYFYVLGAFALLFLIGVTIKYMPFKNKQYHSKDMDVSFQVPGLSIFENECCMMSANFKSLRSTYSLKKSIQSILESYDEIGCNGKVYHYNKKENMTITEYNIEKSFPFNHFNFVYTKGNICHQNYMNHVDFPVIANAKTYSYQKIVGKITFNYTVLIGENGFMSVSFMSYDSASNEIVMKESSKGKYTKEENKIIYTRTYQNEKETLISVPLKTTYLLDGKNLTLEENYIKDYIDEEIKLVLKD